MDEVKSKNQKAPRALEQELRKGSVRASWESANEGVHERVNFGDTIWGFDLAGGAYYDTPLRVTSVHKNSRAERVGIKPGDMLRSINGIETSSLTIQDAHDLIVQSGLEIKLAVTAPDAEETAYRVWQDDIEEDLQEAKLRRQIKVQQKTKVFKGAKMNESWSIAWPCKNKKDILYRESNCFLVPSRYEERHPDKILKILGVKKMYCGEASQ